MEKEHLVPVVIQQVAEKLLTTKNSNERDILIDRLETIRDYCNFIINKVELEQKIRVRK